MFGGMYSFSLIYAYITYIFDKEYITETEPHEKKKSWEFIKLHMLSHLFSDIRMKGVTKNANTQPSEQKHHELKAAWRQTNFRDISPQVSQSYQN